MSSQRATPVALVDDHELVGVAVAAALSDSTVLEYVGWVSDVASLDDLETEPEIVILDLRLADGSSPLQNSQSLIGRGIAVVAYTSGESPYLVRLVAGTPIAGIVRKGAPLSELVSVLESCAAGEIVYSTEWAAALISDTGIDDAGLSPREREILGLLAAGIPTKSVATRLGIALPTLEVHLRRSRDKYARIGRPAETRADLTRRALEDGHSPLPGDPP